MSAWTRTRRLSAIRRMDRKSSSTLFHSLVLARRALTQAPLSAVFSNARWRSLRRRMSFPHTSARTSPTPADRHPSDLWVRCGWDVNGKPCGEGIQPDAYPYHCHNVHAGKRQVQMSAFRRHMHSRRRMCFRCFLEFSDVKKIREHRKKCAEPMAILPKGWRNMPYTAIRSRIWQERKRKPLLAVREHLNEQHRRLEPSMRRRHGHCELRGARAMTMIDAHIFLTVNRRSSTRSGSAHPGTVLLSPSPSPYTEPCTTAPANTTQARQHRVKHFSRKYHLSSMRATRPRCARLDARRTNGHVRKTCADP